jgi:succinyl-CoA synthetase beta subunit
VLQTRGFRIFLSKAAPVIGSSAPFVSAKQAAGLFSETIYEEIYRVAELAQSLKADLQSLEINPLRVDGSQIEALDAVISWRG